MSGGERPPAGRTTTSSALPFARPKPRCVMTSFRRAVLACAAVMAAGPLAADELGTWESINRVWANTPARGYGHHPRPPGPVPVRPGAGAAVVNLPDAATNAFRLHYALPENQRRLDNL